MITLLQEGVAPGLICVKWDDTLALASPADFDRKGILLYFAPLLASKKLLHC